MAAAEQPWRPDVVPPPGSVLRVAAPGSPMGLSVTVLEAGPEAIWITRPGSVATLPPEGPVEVSWTDTGGLHQLAAELSPDGDGRWRLRPRDAIVVDQRRERDRVAVEWHETLVAAGWRLRCTLLDVSPTGVRCLVGGDVVLEEGATCTITLEVVAPHLVAPGVLVRVREALDADLEVAIRFTGLDADARARLERFVADRGGA